MPTDHTPKPNMKNWKLAALLNTPLGLVIVLGLVVLTVELLIMEVIHDALVPIIFQEVYWGFIDTVLLTLIVAPALYFLVFRKMHENEERFRQVNAAALNAIVIVNEQTLITDWNPAAQNMFQYSPEEALGQQMHRLIAPPRYHEDAARGFARFEETGGGPLIGKTTEIAARRKDGSEFPVELSISAVKLKNSWHAIGVMRDITERKQAEDKLAKSERHFRAVAASANDAIITAAGAGNIVGWNAAAGRVFGYTEAEIIGQPLTVLMPERFRDLHSAGLARVAAGGTPHVIGKTVELAGLRKDGSEFPLEFSLAQWQADEGQFFTAIIRDITERKRAEDSLRKLSLAVEQSPNSIVITDLDANIEYVNAAFVKATGYSLAEAIGQNPRLLHSGKTPRATYDDLWAHLTRGEVWQGEFINRRKDGSEYIESALISPVRQPDGRVTNYLAIKEDITEHKRIESDLVVNQTELAMQNEELRQAQIALEESRDQFVDLYEFSPVGYLTLNHEAMIDKINLTATALLGAERNKLLHHRFAPFVATEDRDRWHRHFLDMLQHDGQQRCELALRRSDDSVFHAQLDCLHVKAGGASSVRVTLADITERKRAEAELTEQLEELRGWHDITLCREMRIIDLKHEVDELLSQAGQPPRYPSAESDDPQEK